MAASEEWRMCADWLVRCTILPPDHRALKPSAQIFDLAQALRDGVLLCHLVNNLSPGCLDVKDFSARPQMSQFLCLKNIRSFLQTCKNVFSLRDCDLFDPYDLFDVKDFKLVLQTLSKVSKSDSAQRRGISGFPPDNRQLHDHDYYNSLEEIAAEFPDDFVHDDVGQDEEDKIYDDLCAIRLVLDQTLTQKEMCIKELVDTERNYVDALEMIVTHFINELRHSMKDTDHSIIFAHVEDLHNVHKGFHSALVNACVRNDMVELSEVFINWKKSFLIYGDFCSNLPIAQEMIEDICKRDVVMRTQIEDCQKKANDGKFKLRDLLSVPMQRVLKYHLLLKELIKQTDKKNEEMKDLQKALEAMQDLSFYVNEVKRDNESLQLISEIQNSIVDLQMPPNTSLKDYGRLQKDGELRVRAHPDNKLKSRYIFLYDKVMLMCKSREMAQKRLGETYSYKEALVLGEYTVEESTPSRDQLRRGDKYVYSFMIVQKTKQMAYTFFAKTDEVKRKWIEAIHLALQNGEPDDSKKVGMDFTMHTFEKPTECDVCHKLLRGVFYQGYFCPEPAMSVHKECISKAKPGITPPVPPRQEPLTPTILFKAKAKKPYRGNPKPPNGRPLMFSQNDEIEVLSKESEEWWEGRLRVEVGFFPASFVTRLKRKTSYIESTPMGRMSSNPTLPDTLDSPDPPVENGRVIVSNPPSCIGRPYVNTDQELTQHPWFVGEMSRETAAHKLSGHRSGTFLIRESDNEARRGEFSMSIKYGDNVKHIKVERTAENMYYIADVKYFRSLRELVEYYKEQTLSENFPDLETTLITPIKSSKAERKYIGMANATYDYAATATNQLTLHRGDSIKIISKAGGDKGWWKGEINDVTGYFPLAYVEELSNST